MTTQDQLKRALPLAALIVAVALVAAIFINGGDKQTMHLRFADAGQLVKGDLVEVGGHRVGLVKDISLSDDGQADVRLELNKDSGPWREGTTASIRAVGLSGVTNRYVQLSPGPSTGAVLPDGSTLDTTKTIGIVDLDQLLDSLDKPTRDKLRQVLIDSAKSLDGTEQALNDAFKDLDPAASRSAALLQEVIRDKAALRTLVRSGGRVSKVLADRADEIGRVADRVGTTLDAVAAAKGELGDTLARAPAVLNHGTRTLNRLDRTLDVVGPVVRQIRPSAQPLADTLRAVGDIPPTAEPALRDLQALLKPLRTGLNKVPGLAKVTLPALNRVTSTITEALPIFEQLRPYIPDVVIGLFNGIGGSAGASYDANGHYARLGLVASGQITEGLASVLGVPPTPGLLDFRNDVTQRCPGSAEQTNADGSNPWVPDPSVCNRTADLRKGKK